MNQYFSPSHRDSPFIPTDMSPAETAAYCKDMIASLQAMAQHHGHDLLARILAIALFEAKTLMKQTQDEVSAS